MSIMWGVARRNLITRPSRRMAAIPRAGRDRHHAFRHRAGTVPHDDRDDGVGLALNPSSSAFTTRE
jgi:hypothetical protein